MRMSRRPILFLGLIFCIFSVGCAQQKPMYYWGAYSNSLYESKKTPGAESLSAHREVLENIISESKERGLRVPPGVAAELGYIYGAQNNTRKAIELFQQEKQTYPESTVLMDRLILQAEKRGSSSGETKPVPDKDVVDKEKSIGGTGNDP